MRASSYEEALMVQCMLQHTLRPALRSAPSMVLLLAALLFVLVEVLRMLAHWGKDIISYMIYLKLTQAV